MARDLRLQVIMSAVDRIRRPLRQIRAAGGQTAEALRDTQRQVRELNKQQKDLSGYRRTVVALRGNARALRDARDRHQQYTQALEQQRNAHANIRSNLTTARRAYDQLARSVLDAQRPNAALSTELERARIRLISQQQAFDSSARSLRQYETQTRTANEQVKRLTDTHATSIERLGGLKRRLDDAGISTDNTTRSARQLRDRERELNTALEQQERRLARVAEQQRQLNRARGQYQQGRAVAGNIAGAGGRMLGSGAVSGYATARFLRAGADFDAATSVTQALLRVDKDDEGLVRLREQAREQGATSSFTATQVTGGQNFYAMAGYDADEIEAAIPGTLNLARAGRESIEVAADIASNIMAAMNIPARETDRVADILVAGFTRSNTTLSSVGESMKYLAPVAAQLKLDLETATSMVAVLGDSALQGSMGGTGARRVLLRLVAPTSRAAAALEELGAGADELEELGEGLKAVERVGIRLFDDAGEMRDTVEILRDIHDRAKDLDSERRTQLFSDIAGAQGIGPLEILANRAGSGELGELRENLYAAFDNQEAAENARIVSDNWREGEWLELKSAWESVGITAFEELNDWLRETTSNITRVVRRMDAWMKANPQLTQTIGKVIIVGTALMTVLGGISLAIAGFLGPLVLARFLLAQVGIRFALFTTLAQGAGKAAAGIKAAMAPAIAGVKMLGAALLATPIGWAIAGIAALAAAALLIYKYWQPIKAFFAGFWQGLQAGMGPVASEMAAAFRSILGVLSPLMPVFEGIASVAGALWGWFIQLTTPIDATAETLERAAGAGQIVGEVLGGLIHHIASIHGWFIKAGAALATVFVGSLLDLGTFLASWSPLSLMYNAISGALDALRNDMPSGFVALGQAIVSGLINGITSKFSELGDTMRELGNSIIGRFRNMLGINSPSRVFAEFGGNLLDGLINGIDERWSVLRESIGNLAGGVIGWFKERLGIHSPSRVFAELGRHTMDGYQRGLERNEDGPLATVAAFARQLRQAGAGLALGTLGATAAAAPSAEPITLDTIEFDTRPPITASPDAGSINITIGDIHVHASPGMDEQALARYVAAEVQRALDRAARDAAARRRSAFHDLD